MFELVSRERNPLYPDSDTIYCAYRAAYQDDETRIEVHGCAGELKNIDMLVLCRENRNIEVMFDHGMIWALDHIAGEISSSSVLTARDSEECMEDILRIQEIWTGQYPEIFEIDEYAREKKGNFRELWADEYHLRHGHAFRMLSEPRSEQTADQFIEAIAVEDEPELLDRLFTAFKEYAATDRPLHPCSDLRERLFAAQYLSKKRRYEDPGEVKRTLFRKYPVIGRVLYYLLKPVPILEPRMYYNKVVGSARCVESRHMSHPLKSGMFF